MNSKTKIILLTVTITFLTTSVFGLWAQIGWGSERPEAPGAGCTDGEDFEGDGTVDHHDIGCVRPYWLNPIEGNTWSTHLEEVPGLYREDEADPIHIGAEGEDIIRGNSLFYHYGIVLRGNQYTLREPQDEPYLPPDVDTTKKIEEPDFDETTLINQEGDLELGYSFLDLGREAVNLEDFDSEEGLGWGSGILEDNHIDDIQLDVSLDSESENVAGWFIVQTKEYEEYLDEYTRQSLNDINSYDSHDENLHKLVPYPNAPNSNIFEGDPGDTPDANEDHDGYETVRWGNGLRNNVDSDYAENSNDAPWENFDNDEDVLSSDEPIWNFEIPDTLDEYIEEPNNCPSGMEECEIPHDDQIQQNDDLSEGDLNVKWESDYVSSHIFEKRDLKFPVKDEEEPFPCRDDVVQHTNPSSTDYQCEPPTLTVPKTPCNQKHIECHGGNWIDAPKFETEEDYADDEDFVAYRRDNDHTIEEWTCTSGNCRGDNVDHGLDQSEHECAEYVEGDCSITREAHACGAGNWNETSGECNTDHCNIHETETCDDKDARGSGQLRESLDDEGGEWRQYQDCQDYTESYVADGYFDSFGNSPAVTLNAYTAYEHEEWGHAKWDHSEDDQDYTEDGAVWCGTGRLLTVNPDGFNGEANGWVAFYEGEVVGLESENVGRIPYREVNIADAYGGDVSHEQPQINDEKEEVYEEDEGVLEGQASDHWNYLDQDDVLNQANPGCDTCAVYFNFEYSQTENSEADPMDLVSVNTYEARPDDSYSACRKINELYPNHVDIDLPEDHGEPSDEIITCDYRYLDDNDLADDISFYKTDDNVLGMSPMHKPCAGDSEYVFWMDGPEVSHQVSDYPVHQQKCIDTGNETEVQNHFQENGIQFRDGEYNVENACLNKGRLYQEGVVKPVYRHFADHEPEDEDAPVDQGITSDEINIGDEDYPSLAGKPYDGDSPDPRLEEGAETGPPVYETGPGGINEPLESPDWEVCLDIDPERGGHTIDSTGGLSVEHIGGEWYDLDDPVVREYLREDGDINGAGAGPDLITQSSHQDRYNPNDIAYYWRDNPNPFHPIVNPEGTPYESLSQGNTVEGTSLEIDCGNPHPEVETNNFCRDMPDRVYDTENENSLLTSYSFNRQVPGFRGELIE